MLRFTDLFRGWKRAEHGVALSHSLKAVFTLAMIIVVVLLLTGALLALPFIFRTEPVGLVANLPLMAYFLCIGLGFMLVEISQMQRLIVFLGHPTYGLSVVLFSLLLFSGLGSFTFSRFAGQVSRWKFCLLLLVVLLLAYAVFSHHVFAYFRHDSTPIRISAAILVLAPIALPMGMPFPIGIRTISTLKREHLTPWMWAINGGASVLGSVAGMGLALWTGISSAFVVGLCCYIVALVAFLWARPTRASVA
jgi:hypothetical protein